MRAAQSDQHQFALRAYRPDDAGALLALFRDTVKKVNARDYSPAQIRAWASDEIDAAAWARRFAGRFVVVAEAGGDQVGFIELEFSGHIDRMYVAPAWQGRGVGKALTSAAAAEARLRGIGRLFAEVSITARPFFERQGFSVIAPQEVELRGEKFLNYRMERVLR